jgi:hypothetical protein
MIWIYYLSPFSWAIRAVAVNEMSTPAWSYLPPGQSLTAGQLALQSYDFFYGTQWIWASVVYNMGLFVLLTGAAVWGLQVCRMEPPTAQVGSHAAVPAPTAAVAVSARDVCSTFGHSLLPVPHDIRQAGEDVGGHAWQLPASLPASMAVCSQTWW